MARAAVTARGRASAVIPASLRFEGIGKQFAARDVLKDVTLDIPAAEVVCLLGPSGCGKTTLLRITAGIDHPSSGKVIMDGREIAGPDSGVPIEQRGIGMVFQDYALFPNFTVMENVAFGLRGMSRESQRAAARVAVARVGLDARADAYPHMLSGGEQQRVALARAIVPRPRVLLMDEPFSNLDRRMRDAVREDTVALLRETGATCIMVTHDPEEAMQIADRIVLMRDGQILQSGSPETLYRKPVDVEAARFFCDLNEIPGEIRGGSIHTSLGTFPAKGRKEGPGFLCIRPQGIRIQPSGNGINGRVQAVRFLGETQQVDLRVQDVEHPLRARVRQFNGLRRGADVAIAIDSEEILVFGSEHH
jgi:iron(III) transport system ATP-binding protein